MATFKIRKDQSDQYYWTLRSDGNGKTIARSSESYWNKKDAQDSIDWVKKHALGAGVEDLT